MWSSTCKVIVQSIWCTCIISLSLGAMLLVSCERIRKLLVQTHPEFFILLQISFTNSCETKYTHMPLVDGGPDIVALDEFTIESSLSVKSIISKLLFFMSPSNIRWITANLPLLGWCTGNCSVSSAAAKILVVGVDCWSYQVKLTWNMNEH